MSSARPARSLPVLWVSALLAALVVVAFPATAAAAGTTLFSQSFRTNTLTPGAGAVTVPAAPGGTNTVCLTAAGAPAGATLPSCATITDSNGAGKLRLTNNGTNQRGGLFGATSFPTSQGLNVRFTTYQYGTSSNANAADGIAFVLAAVDPNNPTAPASIGQSGGALGYSPSGTAGGLVGAYLGVGFDVFGNFSSTAYQGSGCTNLPTIVNAQKGQVVVRGPGNGTVGYCGLATTATAATNSPASALRATTRAASAVPVEVVLNPASGPVTTASGLTVAANSYLVAFTPVGAAQRTLTGTLPVVPSGLYPSSSWTTTGGLPRQLAFGWVGSTGGSVDFHEIDNTSVVTLNSVPTLTVNQTAYSAAVPVPGAPVTYTVTPAVAPGLDETAAVTVTETVPTGVTPLGASGTGWVCQPPSGRYVACTNSNGPFANGTALPPITVNAVVTAAGLTAASIQAASTAVASSNDANPGYAPTAAAGTLPAAPAGITLSPASGTISGGSVVTVSGSNLAGATAVEIGTTTEFALGTPSIVLPCSASLSSGCFTVSGGTLVVNGMPAHAVGPVTVKVVTLGVAGSAAYTYLASPAAPTVTAAAGVTGATVTWTVPATNGTPITGYAVTPYRDGVALATRTVAAGVTSTTFTGLSAEVPHTFTVAAVNAVGTGAAGTSAAVTPYTVPGAPTEVVAAAANSAATLRWTAPASTGGSPVTGYVVTPYRGTTAGTPQATGTGTTATVTGLVPGVTYTFRVAAANAAGTGPASASSNAVVVNASPRFTFPAPDDTEVGVATTIPLTIADGTGPYAFSVTAGALPAGLTLDPATGVVSGTPTTAGTSTFTARVRDATGQDDTRAVTLTVVPAPELTFPAPPDGEVGVAYRTPLDVTGGVGPYRWTISAGALPAGLVLDPGTGVVSGTPTATGTATVTVRVTDANGQSATRATTLTVRAQQVLSFPAPPPGEVGVPYRTTLTGSGGVGGYAFAVTAGSLPAGLTLTTAGVLAGTPTAAGSPVVTIAVTDSQGRTSSRAVTVDINARPVLGSTAPADGHVGLAYRDRFTVVGGTAPFSWTVTAGSLPAGLTLDPDTGVLAGTPTTAGSASFTVRVTDALGVSDSAATALRVVPAPSLALPAPPPGEVGTAYTTTFEVDGGTGPYVWTVGSGSLPAGLTLNAATGVLSGTPTAAGSFPVTVRVTDGNGRVADQALTVVVRAATTVALSVSDPSVAFGTAVTLTAVVGPLPATGSVTFRDTLADGPQQGRTVVLGTGTVSSDGTATLTLALPAFGLNTITAAYGGDATHDSQVSAARTVEVTAAVGQLIVREFRLSGPAGAADQFVELHNTGVPIPVAGFRVLGGGGAALTVPASAPVLGTGRSYLVAGAGYSLGQVATADATAPTLGTGGVRVVAPDTAGTVTDAVGSATYTSGTALPALSGTPTDQYAWVRLYGAGRPRDTRDNATDFVLVSTTGGRVGGVQSMLGSPSPAGTGSPFQRNAGLRSTLLDPSAAVTAAPNRVYQPGSAGNPGTLTLRRVVTNTTATAVTSIDLRVTSISEANGAPQPDVPAQPANRALLRIVNAPAQTSSVPVGGRTVTVRNVVLDPPAVSSSGGGMASTLSVPLPGGSLAPGDSVAIAVTFAVDRPGTFWFGYNLDALDAAGPVLRATGVRAGRPTVTTTAEPAGRAPRPVAAGPLARDTGRLG